MDFNQISLTKAIKVNIPVTAKGESCRSNSWKAGLWSIYLGNRNRMSSTSIPKDIEIDVTNLKLGEAITC